MSQMLLSATNRSFPGDHVRQMAEMARRQMDVAELHEGCLSRSPGDWSIGVRLDGDEVAHCAEVLGGTWQVRRIRTDKRRGNLERNSGKRLMRRGIAM